MLPKQKFETVKLTGIEAKPEDRFEVFAALSMLRVGTAAIGKEDVIRCPFCDVLKTLIA